MITFSLKGKVILKKEEMEKELSVGEFFGEQSLHNELNDKCYKYDVKAVTDIRALSLGHQDIKHILGDGISILQ